MPPLELPPIPSLDGLHPIVVHFPIALLIVAPLFVLLGMLKPEKTRCMSYAALILMVLGVASAWVSVASGSAAMLYAVVMDEGQEVLEKHQQLGNLVRTVFTGAAVVYVCLLFLPRIFTKEPKRRFVVITHGVFLALYAGALMLLVTLGHLGGRLVHEFGVQAMMK